MNSPRFQPGEWGFQEVPKSQRDDVLRHRKTSSLRDSKFLWLSIPQVETWGYPPLSLRDDAKSGPVSTEQNRDNR